MTTDSQQVTAARHARHRILACMAFAFGSGAMIVTTAEAHDFWLVPNAFAVAMGQELTVRGQTSSLFPTSGSAVTPDRIAAASLIGAGGTSAISNLSVAGTSLRLRHRPAAAGQYIVAAQIAPRSVRESPASFRRYLELEGAPEALERYAREGRLPTDSVTRRYAKYAKTIVEVGRDGARAFAIAAGHPTELVPLTDPATLRVGDTLLVRFTFRGGAVASAHLHAGSIPRAAAHDDTSAARAASRHDVMLSTDASGVAALVVDRPGTWNVRNIHIVPADPGSGADWDVHWSTLVFEVADRARTSSRGAQTAADTAAAVNAVNQYQRALETGDSTTALALLASRARRSP